MAAKPKSERMSNAEAATIYRDAMNQPELLHFKIWPGERTSGRVSIRPRAVAVVEEVGHHPPAARIRVAGAEYTVLGSYDEVVAMIEKAGASQRGDG